MDKSKSIVAAVIAAPMLLFAVVIVIVVTVSGGSCGAAIPEGVSGSTGVEFDGFTESQLKLARDGVAIGKQRGEAENTIIAELAAQATESGFRNLANVNVPDSLPFPNDGIGADHDSVGPHQLRVLVWGAVGMAALMNPTYQINWFYDQAARLGPEARALDPANLAQAIEKSDPNAYAHSLDLARQLYGRFADVDVSTVLAGGDECRQVGYGAPTDGSFGAAVVAAAQSWIGTPYVWGGGDVNGPTAGAGGGIGFDCSGLSLFAVAKASGGRIVLAHYTQAQQDDTRGMVVPFEQRRPGDLIYFTQPGESDSHHVGIYMGNSTGVDLVINAPATGQDIKVEPLSDWSGERLDIRRFG
ncbi:C40 family peptidase [Nocardia arthritidis]|uniref:Peptidoglycan endopeptidase n=1 Tax=Nocardia arthritidis TaxID=228602 RepID=A0A6G9Y6S0_9NOCA|nr:C40 family peptidase [Nocardia arthritidis]QIS08800.1 peptidoglycan endopeptidase [Nocardia arthritidis]